MNFRFKKISNIKINYLIIIKKKEKKRKRREKHKYWNRTGFWDGMRGTFSLILMSDYWVVKRGSLLGAFNRSLKALALPNLKNSSIFRNFVLKNSLKKKSFLIEFSLSPLKLASPSTVFKNETLECPERFLSRVLSSFVVLSALYQLN